MASYHAQLVIRVLHHLGWMIHFQKSELTPAQDFQFIGMQLRTQDFIVTPLPKMWFKVQVILDHWRWATTVSDLDIHRMLGTIQYKAPLVPRGQLRFRPIQWWALTAWDQFTEDWDEWICVPDWVICQFTWWVSLAVCQSCHSEAPGYEFHTIHRCFTHGMGGSTGRPQHQWSVVMCAEPEPHQHSRTRGSFVCSQRIPESFTWQSGPLMCDNATVVLYIKREGGTRPFRLVRLVIRLLKFVTRSRLCQSQFSFLDVAMCKQTVYHGQEKHSPRSGQTTANHWYQCSNYGVGHG